jgi:CheY-like chemotaxis protein
MYMALRRNLRVLVVDDMSISRQILLQMLEQIGVASVDT